MTADNREKMARDSQREQWPLLMVRAQSGDRQAYNRLLTSLLPAIRTLVRKQISDAVLAGDVVQDVLLTVHRVRHTFDPACPFLPWLMAIVSARSIDALRQQGRQRRWQGASGDTEEDGSVPLAPGRDEPVSARLREEGQRELQHILGQLPLRQREIVEDIHLREMSLADAASKSQLTVAAVKSLLHRALTTLRRYGDKHDRSS